MGTAGSSREGHCYTIVGFRHDIEKPVILDEQEACKSDYQGVEGKIGRHSIDDHGEGSIGRQNRVLNSVSHPEYYVTNNISIDRVRSAISTLDEAYRFLSKSPKFIALYPNQKDIYSLLPLMIKESLLDQSRVSRT